MNINTNEGNPSEQVDELNIEDLTKSIMGDLENDDKPTDPKIETKSEETEEDDSKNPEDKKTVGVGTEESKSLDPVVETAEQKRNHAFASMRAEMNTMYDLLSKSAKALGINATKKDELFEAVRKITLEKEAQSQNIPVETLEKLSRTEQELIQYKQREQEISAYAGVQKLQKEFGLTDQETNTFLANLASKGVNIFTDKIDIKKEYLAENYAALLEKAKRAAVQEEQQRAISAQKHGSKPGTRTGGSEKTPEKINTIDGLEDFLKTLS